MSRLVLVAASALLAFLANAGEAANAEVRLPNGALIDCQTCYLTVYAAIADRPLEFIGPYSQAECVDQWRKRFRQDMRRQGFILTCFSRPVLDAWIRRSICSVVKTAPAGKVTYYGLSCDR